MAGEGAYGLWQVMKPKPFVPADEVSRDDVISVRVAEQYDFFANKPTAFAADGNPVAAIVEVCKVGVSFEASTEMMRQDGELREAIRRVLAGEPAFPESYMWRVVEQRKSLAAQARLTYDRLVVAARRRSDPLASDLIRAHRPYTHERGALLTRPICVVCGDDGRTATQYPCTFVHLVAEGAGLPID